MCVVQARASDSGLNMVGRAAANLGSKRCYYAINTKNFNHWLTFCFFVFFSPQFNSRLVVTSTGRN